MYDVNKKLAKVQVREDIRKQNFDLSKKEFDGQFKLIYKIGKKVQESVHWIVEVSRGIREQVMDAGGRICIVWWACKIVDHLMVSRCYGC